MGLVSTPLYRHLTAAPGCDYIRRSLVDGAKYGFRGYSRGGRNGIFSQRPSDRKLTEGTCHPLKIVCHNPRGERVVGLAARDLTRALFLGLASY
ncbi:MAG: hypothetical protein HY727_19955 [Candidatus Rokubacteria bacterium]|nr:hypothetical protein [Candidatus Rokubacteria bacterium]